MAAGIKTMEILKRPGSYEHLEKITSRLVAGILAAGKEYGHDVCGGSISGMFGFFFCKGPVTSFDDATASDKDKFARWHRMMLERGVYLAPSQVRYLKALLVTHVYPIPYSTYLNSLVFDLPIYPIDPIDPIDPIYPPIYSTKRASRH